MPTSNSYDFSTTRDSIITSALRKLGVLGDYESLDTTRRDAAILAINPMIKHLAALGMPLWAVTQQTIPMSLWTGPSVTIGPGQTINQAVFPLKIVQALRIQNTYEVPLDIQNFNNYNLITNKQSTGAPITLFYHPQNYFGTIYLWPIPDSSWQSTGSLKIRYQREFQDFDNGTDEPDFPKEWHEVLIYQLAVRLAPEYGIPINERMLLKKEADSLLERALQFDTEVGSMFLIPETRYGVH